MGNCAVSRLTGCGSNGPGVGETDYSGAVELCRSRTRLLKTFLSRRSSLAAAHADYVHSLAAVSAALNLFISRHSSPSPILLTFDTTITTTTTTTTTTTCNPSSCSALPCSAPSETSLLRCTPTEPKTEFSQQSEHESPKKDFFEQKSYGEEMGYGYFYQESVGSGGGSDGFGWDYFNPFDGVRTEMVAGLSSEEELRAVREEEGIPELEEEEEKMENEEVEAVVVEKVKQSNGGGGEEEEEHGEGQKGMEVAVETPEEEGRELLEALKEVERLFERAYNAGREVSRMLEAHRVILPPAIDDINETKDSSSKIMQVISWHRTPSSLSSSSKSYLASSSAGVSWDESLFDDYVGMGSGSHSQTLGRLYAWERKLYEEVKAGDETRQVYQKKCMQLRNLAAKGAESRSTDKTKANVRDLYSRILVMLRSAETISAKIEKLRDEELEPQLMELLEGLTRAWKVMLETHDTQKQIMSEVEHFSCSSYGKFCNDSQRQATMKLEAELRYWRTCFINYVAAQKAYVETLDGWLSMFIMPEVEYFSRSKTSRPAYGVGTPRLVMVCHEWLVSLRKLPDSPVSYSMKIFIKDVRVLWAKQGQEQQQKRKVDDLAKELDRKVHSLQKAENKILESKVSNKQSESNVRQRAEYLTGKKEMLEMFRKKLESEKTSHHNCMLETERITLNGFRTGLINVFESLSEFSKDSANIYGELLKWSDKLKLMDGTAYCIEGSQGAESQDTR